MDFTVTMNCDAVNQLLDSITERCSIDQDEIQIPLAAVLQDDIHSQFESQGDPAWTPDSVGWMKQKQYRGLILKTGQATGRLKQSYGYDGTPGSDGFVNKNPGEITVGSNVEYADEFHGGTGDSPYGQTPRPLRVTEYATQHGINLIERYTIKGEI